MEDDEDLREHRDYQRSQRTIHELLGDSMRRGDEVAITLSDSTQRGLLDLVGEDFARLRTPAGEMVLIRLHRSDDSGGCAPPLLMIRTTPARAGGTSGARGPTHFSAQLRELTHAAPGAYAGEPPTVVIGTSGLGAVEGRLQVVARDHAIVVDGYRDVVVPLAVISFVRVRSN